jgi:SAM-dependent methyltransferase
MNDNLKIFDSTKRPSFYWGVSSRELANQFIDKSERVGFFEAIKEEKFSVFKKYASSTERANFLKSLEIPKTATVLDLGSGYGNITIPLSKMVKEVYACDSALELLEFSRQRAIAENISNIKYFRTDPIDFCDTPFEEKTFDVIILNGVLEWVGTGDLSRNPGLIQEEVLKYLRTLLKDDGFIYIGIENRWWPMYFYNIKDPHTKKMWTAIFPRFVSNVLMRLYGEKSGYRNYIYSLFGYRKLFNNAGFLVKDLFLPIKSYREPKYMLKVNDREGINNLAKNNFCGVYHWKVVFLLKCLHFFGLLKFFTHSFGFVLKKDK